MTSKTITLNIGMRTRDGAELPLHRMQSCVKQTFGALSVLFMKQCDTPGEPTLVVQVARDPHPFRPRVKELAFRLRQDCIAWKYDQNGDSEYMTGPGADKYGPFDIKKFITKEQAMSYGHPTNPPRFVKGDKVRLTPDSKWYNSSLWGSPMTVNEVYPSGSVSCRTVGGVYGAFPIDTLQHVQEPAAAGLEKRIAQLEQDVKGLCLQITTKAAPAKTFSKEDYELLARIVGYHTKGTRLFELYKTIREVGGIENEWVLKAGRLIEKDGRISAD
jgi:hypothetical protein